MTTQSSWSALLAMLWQQKAKMSAAFTFTLIAAIAELVPFWLLYLAVELLLNPANNTAEQLSELAMYLAICYLVKSLMYAVAYYFSHHAAFDILTSTRRQLVHQLANASLPWLQQHSAGSIKHKVLQDVENIENFFAHHTVEVLAAVIGPVVVGAFLFWLDWRLALAALAIAPLAAATSLLFMRGLAAEYLTFNHAEAQLDATTLEYVRTMPVVKLFKQDSARFAVMRQRLDNYYNLVDKLTKHTIPGWALFTCLLGASALAILPLGIYLHQVASISASTVVLAILLGAGMLKPWLKISRFFMEINQVLAGVDQLLPILQLPKPSQLATQKFALDIDIHFDQVNFAYGDKIIMTNFNLTLTAGSFTAIVGSSGAGKTTAAHLLAGLLTPTSGSIRLNDQPLSDINPAQLTELVAVASQESFLFKGTIGDNLLLASRNTHADTNDQTLAIALKVAQAESLINELELGLDTPVNEQGVRLSGGEKQRICIARALLANTPIVILDEAAASLDNLSQQTFYRDLRHYYPTKTFLVIAHRSYGLDAADQIVVLQQGHIAAVGNHHQLLANNQFYQQLHQHQSDIDNWSLRSDTSSPVTEIKNHA